MDVARAAAKMGLAGLEFLIGIPGTIGGGLRMNAGAYGTEFKDIVITAKEAIDRQVKPITSPQRTWECVIAIAVRLWIKVFSHAILQARFGEVEEIRARMKDIVGNRADAQPRGVRTGGSTFANPDGHKAWQLIDQAGYRGHQLGQAMVSDKHCNFLINNGGATAHDIETLGSPFAPLSKTMRGLTCAGKSAASVQLLKPLHKEAMMTDRQPIDRSGLTLILMGGWTAEAEVSRNSGKACYDSAIRKGWTAECLEVERDIAQQLITRKPARVFNALRGQMGEDGNIQGLLNLLEIPYTHSGLLSTPPSPWTSLPQKPPYAPRYSFP